MPNRDAEYSSKIYVSKAMMKFITLTPEGDEEDGLKTRFRAEARRT
jgi:hypothetical protein